MLCCKSAQLVDGTFWHIGSPNQVILPSYPWSFQCHDNCSMVSEATPFMRKIEETSSKLDLWKKMETNLWIKTLLPQHPTTSSNHIQPIPIYSNLPISKLCPCNPLYFKSKSLNAKLGCCYMAVLNQGVGRGCVRYRCSLAILDFIHSYALSTR